MKSFIKLYSNEGNEIKNFLSIFFNISNISQINNLTNNTLEYRIDYDNPIVMSDIISIFIDNKDKYNLSMWLSLDKDILINVTENNANDIIKYLYERYPY